MSKYRPCCGTPLINFNWKLNWANSGEIHDAKKQYQRHMIRERSRDLIYQAHLPAPKK